MGQLSVILGLEYTSTLHSKDSLKAPITNTFHFFILQNRTIFTWMIQHQVTPILLLAIALMPVASNGKLALSDQQHSQG